MIVLQGDIGLQLEGISQALVWGRASGGMRHVMLHVDMWCDCYCRAQVRPLKGV